MDLGIANRDTLKKWLLTEQLLNHPDQGDDYDAVIDQIGIGVSAMFERYCARKFRRVEGDTFVCTADRPSVILPRYPVESVASVEIRYSAADGWQTLTGQPIDTDPESGIVEFAAVQGSYRSRLRITYTGGYFTETLELDDEGYPTSQPSEATPVPEALKHAWLTQCQSSWQRYDKLGASFSLVDAQGVSSVIFEDGLLPTVEATLKTFTRFQLF